VRCAQISICEETSESKGPEVCYAVACAPLIRADQPNGESLLTTSSERPNAQRKGRLRMEHVRDERLQVGPSLDSALGAVGQDVQQRLIQVCDEEVRLGSDNGHRLRGDLERREVGRTRVVVHGAVVHGCRDRVAAVVMVVSVMAHRVVRESEGGKRNTLDCYTAESADICLWC
jgi:hypothetical protein